MIRWSALLLGLLVHPPTPVSVRGRVIRIVGSDTLSAAGARVVLHAVTPDSQGPVDSVIADGMGRFQVRSQVDSGAIVLVSARWHGVEYFAPPVAPGEPVTLVVVDTSSTQTVDLAARHVIVGGAAADGARDVVDLVVLRNAGPATRVGGGGCARTDLGDPVAATCGQPDHRRRGFFARGVRCARGYPDLARPDPAR